MTYFLLSFYPLFLEIFGGWPDLTLKAVAALGAFIAFCLGLKQYKQAQDWKRAEVVLDLIEEFKTTEPIRAACIMLDWDGRYIEVNGKSAFRFENSMLPSALRVIWMDSDHSIPEDKTNLRSDSVDDQSFSEVEALIRDCFDAFFDYFDKINAFRRSALVPVEDLGYFFYWLDLLNRVGENKGDPRIQKAFDAYVQVYSFGGYLELKNEYASFRGRQTLKRNTLKEEDLMP